MASGITNKGIASILKSAFQNQTTTPPTGYYLALVTSAASPSFDTNTWSQLSANEIAAGNGYTANGQLFTANSTNFPTLTEDDTNDLASITLKDVTWTASGGSIPSSGSGARYLILMDANGTPANREVIAWFDLQTDRSASIGTDLTVASPKATFGRCG
jgi:hypothetical protein